MDPEAQKAQYEAVLEALIEREKEILSLNREYSGVLISSAVSFQPSSTLSHH